MPKIFSTKLINTLCHIYAWFLIIGAVVFTIFQLSSTETYRTPAEIFGAILGGNAIFGIGYVFLAVLYKVYNSKA